MMVEPSKNKYFLRKISSQDSLANLLIFKLKLNFYRMVLAMILVCTFYGIITPANSIDIWAWRLFLYPLISGFYLWVNEALEYLLVTLENESIVNISNADWKLSSKLYRSSAPKYSSICFAVATSVLFIISRPNYRFEFVFPSLLDLARVFGAFVGSYMASMTAILLVMNAYLVWEILRSKAIELEPLHPDQCGGLKPLSQYSLKTSYIVATYGMIIGLTEYRFIIRGVIDDFWVIHFSIPIYVILSLAAFFTPLLTAHSKLVAAKKDLLNQISAQFQKDHKELMLLVASSDQEGLEKKQEKINKLEEIYANVCRFPEWPFDATSLRKYFYSSVTPIIPIFLALIQKTIDFWLEKWGVFS